MIRGKEAYLRKLTENIRMRSVDVGQRLDGSCPPSVFIGSWNYPKVYAGPLIAPIHGDTAVMDMPEKWIPQDKTQEDIIGFRLSLVRGKKTVGITDLDNPFVSKLQDIALSKNSVETEAEFCRAPRGTTFSDDHTPFGPSAELMGFDVGNSRWDHDLEKVYYDIDLKAADAVMMLHEKELPFSSIQKAFSVGAMGMKRRRHLVPTGWSITACDSTIANNLLEDVKHYDILDTFRVHEFSSLNNYYAVMLMPTSWQYEWIEAFLHILGREQLIFSDHEYNTGKKEYSCVGGCYYSCKMAVLEALARERKQAGAIILREAYHGYVPLGVFNVRENVRNAMKQTGTEFEDMRSALRYIGTKLRLPVSSYIRESTLLKELLQHKQLTLTRF